MDPENRVEKIRTLILTHLVENGNQIDNGNDSQIDLAITSDESFIFPKQLSDLLTNIHVIHEFES